MSERRHGDAYDALAAALDKIEEAQRAVNKAAYEALQACDETVEAGLRQTAKDLDAAWDRTNRHYRRIAQRLQRS